MAKYRYLQCNFWIDPEMQDLSPEDKSLYIYFLTNPYTTQAGIYQIPLRSASAETGYPMDTISKGLANLIERKKIRYNKDTFEVAIKNWPKYNVTKSPKVIKCIKEELEKVKDKALIDFVYSETGLFEEYLQGINTPSIPYTNPIDKEKENNIKENNIKEKEIAEKMGDAIHILETSKSSKKSSCTPDLNCNELFDKKFTEPKKQKSKTSEIEEEFETVWKSYPNKEGKPGARKAWKKLREEFTPEQFIQIINNYKETVKRASFERPWLHGSTFFNGRYEDFLEGMPEVELIEKSNLVVDKAHENHMSEFEKLCKRNNLKEYTVDLSEGITVDSSGYEIIEEE